jgi:hypothetical protein
VAFLFSPKALFSIAGLVAGLVVTAIILSERRVESSQYLLMTLGGFHVPVLLALGFMARVGMADAFVHRVLLDNFSYQERWFPVYLFRPIYWPLFALGVTGVWRVWRVGIKAMARNGDLLLAIWGGVVAFIVIFMMPAPNTQAVIQFSPFLPCLPVASGHLRKSEDPFELP